MRLSHAHFSFVHGKYGAIGVTFAYRDGKPTEVTVMIGRAKTAFDNAKGRLKPCATHCQDLIERSLPEPKGPRDNFAKQRRDDVPVKLRIARAVKESLRPASLAGERP